MSPGLPYRCIPSDIGHVHWLGQISSCSEGPNGPQPETNHSPMVEFIESVDNPRLAERMSRAIEGRGAFRRFKDTLLEHEPERQR